MLRGAGPILLTPSLAVRSLRSRLSGCVSRRAGAKTTRRATSSSRGARRHGHARRGRLVTVRKIGSGKTKLARPRRWAGWCNGMSLLSWLRIAAIAVMVGRMPGVIAGSSRPAWVAARLLHGPLASWRARFLATSAPAAVMGDKKDSRSTGSPSGRTGLARLPSHPKSPARGTWRLETSLRKEVSAQPHRHKSTWSGCGRLVPPLSPPRHELVAPSRLRLWLAGWLLDEAFSRAKFGCDWRLWRGEGVGRDAGTGAGAFGGAGLLCSLFAHGS
jgi:hypothetical protein